MNLGPLVKNKRKSKGLSQVQLAGESNVSLPTIQNIEAGKANPTWEVMQKLGKVLGFEPHVIPTAPDIEDLAELGVPIMKANMVKKPWKANILTASKIPIIRDAIIYVNYHSKGNYQLRDALFSWLLALRDHYPTFFQKYLGHHATFSQFLKHSIEGNHIKLRRIAIANLSQII